LPCLLELPVRTQEFGAMPESRPLFPGRKTSWTNADFEEFRREKQISFSSIEQSDTDSFMHESSINSFMQESVASDVKYFEPMHVKVQNGIAHLVARVGRVLVYVETQVGQTYAPAKLWVLGNITSAIDDLDDVTLTVAVALSRVEANVKRAYASVKATGITMSAPLYAKIVRGVLHMRCVVGNTTIYMQGKVSQTWASLVAYASSSYAISYQTAVRCLKPGWVWTSSQAISAKALMVRTTQPYWLMAADGSLYVQQRVGSTLIRMKVSMNERIFAPALFAYASVQGYSAQILAKVVSIYDLSKARVFEALASLLEKGQSMATYTTLLVKDMVVGVKVKLAAKCDSARQGLSLCYVKFKNGFVYINGMVGDKVVYVKISLADLVRSLAGTATALKTEAKARVFAATDSLQHAAASVAIFGKCKASLLRSKVQVAVKDQSMQATAVGAAGGAATMAVGGGGAGLATGTVVGAALGVLPALFTFGLSIPIGAAVGGATGLCAGAFTGGTVGLIGGGATANSVHRHRDGIKGGAIGALNKASGCKDFVTTKARVYTDSVVESTMNVRSRLVGGTGGTTSD